MSTSIQQHLKQQRPFRTAQEEVFVGLQLVADRLMQPWAAYLKKIADLTPVQYNVLRILRGAGPRGLWAGEIGERLITRSPDVTRLIDRLEKRGLVRRTQDEADRRAVRVHITRPGRDLLEPLDQKARTELQRAFDVLTARQLGMLRDQLAAVLEGTARG